MFSIVLSSGNSDGAIGQALITTTNITIIRGHTETWTTKTDEPSRIVQNMFMASPSVPDLWKRRKAKKLFTSKYWNFKKNLEPPNEL